MKFSLQYSYTFKCEECEQANDKEGRKNRDQMNLDFTAFKGSPSNFDTKELGLDTCVKTGIQPI